MIFCFGKELWPVVMVTAFVATPRAASGSFGLLATIMSMFFLCSLAVLFSIKSRVSIEKPQTNSFSVLCAPTQAKISSVRSRAIFISPSCFLTLSAATVAGR